MKLNSKTYEKKIWFILLLSPMLFAVVITSLILAAKAHDTLLDQIPGILMMVAIAFAVFGMTAYNLKISAKEVEIINDELRLNSPKYGYLILKRADVRRLEKSHLISPLNSLTIHDSNGRKHKLIIAPWVENLAYPAYPDPWKRITDWWTAEEKRGTLPNIRNIDPIQKKRFPTDL
jgi:hypothetical protein